MNEKEKLQEEAVALFAANRAIMLNWATGCGKSVAAIKCAHSVRYAFIKHKPTILLIVAEELHKQNWRDEFIKWGYEDMLDNVTIECYASLPKYVGTTYECVIFDECHHLSELKVSIGETIMYGKAILLSATVSEEIKMRIRSIIDFVEFNVSLDEAIDRFILPAPKIHLINVPLDDKIKRHTVMFNKKKAVLTDRAMNANFARKVINLEDLKQKLEREGKASGWIGQKMIILGGQRKKFLAEAKTEAAKLLLERLKNKRYICFTGSTQQCEELGADHSLNSSRGKKHNIATLHRFYDGEIRSLFVNKMGKEGLNLTGIEAAVIVQLDSGNDSGLSFLQRTGRSLRADNPEVYIMYCKGTQDDKYLAKALQNIDNKYIVKENL